MQPVLQLTASWGKPRLALAGAAVLAVLLGTLWWQMGAWRGPAHAGTEIQSEGDICIVAPPVPYDQASGLPMHAARAVPADARCPVCGMFPARFSGWAAQVIFDNGDAQFFDSPLSLFMYLQNPGRYSPGRSASQIVARYVTDASSRQWIDAHNAWYVHGSTATGPMRLGNFPAFQLKDDALQFAHSRGGRVLAFGAVDGSVVDPLAQKGLHHMHSRQDESASAIGPQSHDTGSNSVKGRTGPDTTHPTLKGM